MTRVSQISPQNRSNWLVDAILFSGAAIATLSGVYFLFNPGGYQGGRNLAYNTAPFLFDRVTWDMLHTWSGIVMILVVAIHLPRHWKWVTSMTGRIGRALRRQSAGLSGRGWYNLWLNAIIGISFLLTALSGLYFLFLPGGPRSRLNAATVLFDRTTWDAIHTWAGVALVIAAVLHIAIHWRWIANVTRAIFVHTEKQSSNPRHAQ